MKRTLALIVAFAVAFTFVLPSIALADKGGVPNEKSGKTAPAPDEEGDAVRPGKPDKAAKPEKGPKDEPPGKAKQKAKELEGSEDGSATVEPERDRDRDQDRSGIENALSHLETNLARMQADLDAGLRKQLPPGLVKVIEKFMSWLGIGTDGEEPPAGPDDGLEDDEGSVEETGTVEPTSTVEPTTTVEPTE